MTFKWVVPAGHGYQTAGKQTPDGMKEYEFNRAVASYIKEFTLAEYEGIEVHLPHSDARDVPLKERTDYANRIKADCYTAIHANAYGSGWNNANGIEIWIYKTRPQQAYALALQVQRDLITETGLADRGVKLGDLHEVRESKMTGILCECGFMTNKIEAALLKSDEYRRKVAKAIVRAHASFFGWKKKSAPPPPTVKNGWLQEKDKWYYFENNLKKTGWLKWDGRWWYLQSDGVMVADQFLKIGEFWYYFHANGQMLNNTTLAISEDGAFKV